MQDDSRIAAPTGVDRIWLAGYLGSILIAVGFVVVGIPWLFRATGFWSVGLGLLFVAAPLVSRLRDPERMRNCGFVRHYLIELVDLGRRLLTVLAILPSVAAQLLLVIGGVLVIAMFAILSIGAVQHAFGLQFAGISEFSRKDLIEAGVWMASTLAVMVIAGMLLRGMRRLAPTALRGASRADDSVRRWLAARLT